MELESFMETAGLTFSKDRLPFMTTSFLMRERRRLAQGRPDRAARMRTPRRYTLSFTKEPDAEPWPPRPGPWIGPLAPMGRAMEERGVPVARIPRRRCRTQAGAADHTLAASFDDALLIVEDAGISCGAFLGRASSGRGERAATLHAPTGMDGLDVVGGREGFAAMDATLRDLALICSLREPSVGRIAVHPASSFDDAMIRLEAESETPVSDLDDRLKGGHWMQQTLGHVLAVYEPRTEGKPERSMIAWRAGEATSATSRAAASRREAAALARIAAFTAGTGIEIVM